MPSHPVAQALISAAQMTLAAPSANRFGRISPTTPQAVEEELGDRIEWILDGGACQIGVESTVISVNEIGEVYLLRPGGTPQSEIEKLIGISLLTPVQNHSLSVENLINPPSLASPGMLESHYAPRKPLYLLPHPYQHLGKTDFDKIRTFLKERSPIEPVGLLLLSGSPEKAARLWSEELRYPVIARTLSLNGDLRESARNLFAELRYLDSSEASILFTEPCLIQDGLGHAISDRLRRASLKTASELAFP
jgi:L-threonylcarbamoyladenylate synthase